MQSYEDSTDILGNDLDAMRQKLHCLLQGMAAQVTLTSIGHTRSPLTAPQASATVGWFWFRTRRRCSTRASIAC